MAEDEAVVTSLRQITIKNKQSNNPLTFAHLKALVSMLSAADYPDDALVITPQAVHGLTQLSVRQGE